MLAQVLPRVSAWAPGKFACIIRIPSAKTMNCVLFARFGFKVCLDFNFGVASRPQCNVGLEFTFSLELSWTWALLEPHLQIFRTLPFPRRPSQDPYSCPGPASTGSREGSEPAVAWLTRVQTRHRRQLPFSACHALQNDIDLQDSDRAELC